MSLGATMTLLGLYNYDPSILSAANLKLPAAVHRNDLLPDLLAQAAAFELLYPEPETLKMVLRSWTTHRLPVWERIAKAAALEYDPIENYDRREEWTDSGSGMESSSDTTGNSGSSQTDSYSAGYNPNALGDPPGMVKQNQENTTGSTSGSVSHSGNNSGTATHSGRVHGNIGVTTSQQMLEQEINIASRLDVYNYIIVDVISRICIPLY